MFKLDIKNWYWQLADGRVWSTKRADFVSSAEPDINDWLKSTGLPEIPRSPVDTDGIGSESGLYEALVYYKLPLGTLMPDEEKYYAERAAVDAKYSAPWNGLTGGILTVLQMTMSAAQCEVPQNPEKIAGIGMEYQSQKAAMQAKFEAIDEKYGV